MIDDPHSRSFLAHDPSDDTNSRLRGTIYWRTCVLGLLMILWTRELLASTGGWTSIVEQAQTDCFPGVGEKVDQGLGISRRILDRHHS